MSGQTEDQWFYDQNLDRWEVIANLKDWVDSDTTRSGTQEGYEDNYTTDWTTHIIQKPGHQSGNPSGRWLAIRFVNDMPTD